MVSSVSVLVSVVSVSVRVSVHCEGLGLRSPVDVRRAQLLATPQLQACTVRARGFPGTCVNAQLNMQSNKDNMLVLVLVLVLVIVLGLVLLIGRICSI